MITVISIQPLLTNQFLNNHFISQNISIPFDRKGKRKSAWSVRSNPVHTRRGPQSEEKIEKHGYIYPVRVVGAGWGFGAERRSGGSGSEWGGRQCGGSCAACRISCELATRVSWLVAAPPLRQSISRCYDRGCVFLLAQMYTPTHFTLMNLANRLITAHSYGLTREVERVWIRTKSKVIAYIKRVSHVDRKGRYIYISRLVFIEEQIWRNNA